MVNQTDSGFPLNLQYQDSRKLSARAALHQRFSTNPADWHSWVLSRLDLNSTSHYLEIGCGPAYLWPKNEHDLPPGCRIILTDISRGMILEACNDLKDCKPFSFAEADAAHLPFRESIFSGVIANHMLYHLETLADALKEIYRVLQPASCLYAATNGKEHLKEIKDWKEKFLPGQRCPDWGTAADNFSLENGRDQLAHWFPEVKLHLYPDQLLITEIEPIILYINSYLDQELDPDTLDELRNFLKAKLAKNGSIRITKRTGLFIATKT